jgi:hypothetical protein
MHLIPLLSHAPLADNGTTQTISASINLMIPHEMSYSSVTTISIIHRIETLSAVKHGLFGVSTIMVNNIPSLTHGSQ